MKQKGYVLIVALIILTSIVVMWYLYFWKKQWFSSPSFNPGKEKTKENKNINEQLNDLRGDMKNIQDKRDQEIYEAAGEAGQSAEEIIK